MITRITLPADAVLVLGAGLAGLYCALKLSPKPAVLVSAARAGEASSSAWAQGGMAAALGPGDSPERHAADTIAVGAGLVDPDMARLLTEAGPQVVRDLADLGVPFDRNADGRFALGLEAAHARPRVARVKGDLAGREITSAVANAARACASISIKRRLIAVRLLQRADGRVGGALCVNQDNELVALEANETVLALGGAGGLYAVTTNPPIARGDALAMALRAGASAADLEFVQFHPTAIDAGIDPAPLASEALRGDGAILVDRDETPLVDPLGPRDATARAVHMARQDGRGAFLDARAAIGAAFPNHFPTVFSACQNAGIDPRTALIPVAPAAHYHMGGVATDADGRTDRGGLWAVGECASTGVHGGNRLASNSLLEAVVFAARAARALKDAASPSASPLEPVEPPPTLSPEALMRLRESMAAQCGVVRDARGLTRLLSTLDAIDGGGPPSNASLSARAIATSALARRESRGAHARSDALTTAHTPQRSKTQFIDGVLKVTHAPA